MSTRARAIALACLLSPAVSLAQSSPVAVAFRTQAKEMQKNLIAAAKVMPADKYGYKPTPAQMSFGNIVMHLSGGNDILCANIAGIKMPTRAKLAPTADKEALVARLTETFQFCDDALAKLDDSKLAESLTIFGSTMTRASAMLETTGDWSDHYSQAAIYLRLNGLLPPTAKK